MFTIVRTAMFSWIYTNVKIYHIVYLNYVECPPCQFYL